MMNQKELIDLVEKKLNNYRRNEKISDYRLAVYILKSINYLPQHETSKVGNNEKAKEDCSMHSEECNKKSCDDCFHQLSLI